MNSPQRTNQLLLYIRDQRRFGKSDSEIRIALTEDGYSDGYVDRLFVHLVEETTTSADLDDPVDEPTDNGLATFGIGVAIVAVVTLITFVVLQFTDSWSLVFWGFSLLGVWGVAKGIYLGLKCPDSGQAKARRLALYVLGLGVVGVCAFWTWTTFYEPRPPLTDVNWSESTSRPARPGGEWFRLTGTIKNESKDWRLVDLELTVTPVNAFGDPIATGEVIKFSPAPSGISPQQTVSYSEEIKVSRFSRGFEESLHWKWEKE